MIDWLKRTLNFGELRARASSARASAASATTRAASAAANAAARATRGRARQQQQSVPRPNRADGATGPLFSDGEIGAVTGELRNRRHAAMFAAWNAWAELDASGASEEARREAYDRAVKLSGEVLANDNDVIRVNGRYYHNHKVGRNGESSLSAHLLTEILDNPDVRAEVRSERIGKIVGKGFQLGLGVVAVWVLNDKRLADIKAVKWILDREIVSQILLIGAAGATVEALKEIGEVVVTDLASWLHKAPAWLDEEGASRRVTQPPVVEQEPALADDALADDSLADDARATEPSVADDGLAADADQHLGQDGLASEPGIASEAGLAADAGEPLVGDDTFVQPGSADLQDGDVLAAQTPVAVDDLVVEPDLEVKEHNLADGSVFTEVPALPVGPNAQPVVMDRWLGDVSALSEQDLQRIYAFVGTVATFEDDVIRPDQSIDVEALGQKLDMTPEATRERLDELTQHGVVQKVGDNYGLDHRGRYAVTQASRTFGDSLSASNDAGQVLSTLQ